MFNFILLFFFVLILTNILQFYPSLLLTLSQYTYLDQSIIYLLPGIVHFISGVTHMETCSKLMFTNGKNVVSIIYDTILFKFLLFLNTYLDQSIIYLLSGIVHFISGVGAVIVEIIWQLDLQLPVQSVPITTKIVSSKNLFMVRCTRHNI